MKKLELIKNLLVSALPCRNRIFWVVRGGNAFSVESVKSKLQDRMFSTESKY